MQGAHKHVLIFNDEKCAVWKPSVTFFGFVNSKNGAHPNPAKVIIVPTMPAPKSQNELQELLTYLLPFILSLFIMVTLCELLKMNKVFSWNQSFLEAFDNIQHLVCTNMNLCILMGAKSSQSR